MDTGLLESPTITERNLPQQPRDLSHYSTTMVSEQGHKSINRNNLEVTAIRRC